MNFYKHKKYGSSIFPLCYLIFIIFLETVAITPLHSYEYGVLIENVNATLGDAGQSAATYQSLRSLAFSCLEDFN